MVWARGRRRCQRNVGQRNSDNALNCIPLTAIPLTAAPTSPFWLRLRCAVVYVASYEEHQFEACGIRLSAWPPEV